jgi:hypothetical protein
LGQEKMKTWGVHPQVSEMRKDRKLFCKRRFADSSAMRGIEAEE